MDDDCHASAAMRVLTDASLLDTVTSSVDGYSQCIVEFYRRIQPQYGSMYDVRRVSYPRNDGFLLHVAIAENNMAVLQTLLKLRQRPLYRTKQFLSVTRVMRCAAYFGRLSMLEYLFETLSRDPAWTWELDMLQTALENPHPDIEVVRWLCQHCPKESLLLQDGTMGPADLATVQCLLQHDCILSYTTPTIAAERGHLDTLRFLFERERYPDNSSWGYGVSRAAENGHLDVVRYLHEIRARGFSKYNMDSTAANGHLEIVQFLHEHRIGGCTTVAMDEAAANGHLGIIRFLHAHRTEGCTTYAMDEAAARGHLDVVRFLHEHRSEGCTTDAIDYAAGGGHLDGIQFLNEHRREGCTTDAMDLAVAGGHFAVVRYLVAHYPESLSASAIDTAAELGHLDILRFLLEHSAEGCSTWALDKAAHHGHIDVVAFLCEHYAQAWSVKVSVVLPPGAVGDLDPLQHLDQIRSDISHYRIEREDRLVQTREHLLDVRDYLRVRFATMLDEDTCLPFVDLVKLQCQRYPDSIADSAFTDVAGRGGDRYHVLAVLCAYSTRGCLLEAREIAQRNLDRRVLNVLDAYIASDVAFCSLAQHAAVGPRRCQTAGSSRARV